MVLSFNNGYEEAEGEDLRKKEWFEVKTLSFL